MDVRPGGSFRILMRGPDGTEYPNKAVYREVVAPERLVYTDDWDDGRPSQEAIVTVTFAEADGKTLLTIRMRYKSVEDRDAMLKLGAVEGFSKCMDRLEAHLANA